MSLRCVYLDLDGTLLGKYASLLHDGEGKPSILGARALEACHRADVEVVLMTGRRKEQAFEDARLVGARSFIYEVGAALVVDGEEEYLSGDLLPTPTASIYEQITAAGVPDLLLSTYKGQLEYHDPWHLNREITHLFRGSVDVDEVNKLLTERGFSNLKITDNGSAHRRSPDLAELAEIRVYHLLPRVSSKSMAVARHAQIREYRPSECIAVGDSREDITVAAAVGTFWLVANALQKDSKIGEFIANYDNVRTTESGWGGGVYEAVITSIQELRGAKSSKKN